MCVSILCFVSTLPSLIYCGFCCTSYVHCQLQMNIYYILMYKNTALLSKVQIMLKLSGKVCLEKQNTLKGGFMSN